MDRDTSTEKAFFELNHAQVFVYVLMTVISILFLFITNAYLFRMNFQDWSPMPIPTLLWFNTACLLLASIGMAWSKSGAKVGDLQKIKVGLVLGGIFAVILLVKGDEFPTSIDLYLESLIFMSFVTILFTLKIRKGFKIGNIYFRPYILGKKTGFIFLSLYLAYVIYSYFGL